MIDVSSFGWPQWLVLIFIALVIINIARLHNRTVSINAVLSISIWIVFFVVLVVGGFFRS